jgi:hypothetical protein
VADALSVAIVGMGPRGLSVLERLLIRLAARPPATRPVVIWAIDPVEHGPGRVWRTDQPEWLTMNATAGEVTVRSPDNALLPEGTATGAASFADWTTEAGGPHLLPTDYPERRHYGRYLRAVFDALCARAPAGVRIHPVRGTATALHRFGAIQWLVIDRGRQRLRVDKVVLATGHAQPAPSPAERLLRDHADRHRGLGYVGSGPAADMPLSLIAPGSTVAVRGLGLTFYDVIRSLTLGRGGRFTRCTDGTVHYLPSGREPLIIAGSRSGLPFLARPALTDPPPTAPTPVALTGERIRALRAQALATRGTPQLDFAAEVEPLIGLEMDHAYYRCAAGIRGGAEAAARFGAAFQNVLDGHLSVDRDRIDRLLAVHHLDDLAPVRFTSLASPFHAVDHGRRYRQHLVDLLRRDVGESRRGVAASPLKAALEALRTLRPALPAVVDFGGLTPASHRDFLTRWAPMSFTLSAGPPTWHVEQLLALLHAGIVALVGPSARFGADRTGRCFTIESPVVPGSRRSTQVLLDAHVPTTDLRRDTAPLVRRLLAEGRITEYVNVGPGEQEDSPDSYRTGGLAVTPAPCRVVDAAGRTDPDLYAIGVATEHTRWFTQVGTGRPGQDSPFRREADAIAAHILSAAHPQEHDSHRPGQR